MKGEGDNSVNNNLYKKRAFKRLRFSLIIILVYIIGSNISVPGVNSKVFMELMGSNPTLSLALGMTGLSLENFSLFSIGLGPWMSTLIFWRVLTVAKVFNLESMTSSQSYRLKFILSMGFGVIQSLGILSQMGPLGPASDLSRWMLVFFLITGLSIIIWLGNINKLYGYGGPTLIILINIMRQLPRRFAEQFSGTSLNILNISLIVLSVIFGIFILFVIFRFYQGERRLPLMHVMLDGSYSQNAYIPIPTNPAGGMPYMYAFSMVLFPQYFLSLFGGGTSNYSIVRFFYTQFQLDQIGGVILLVLTVIVLTFGFSYVNVDYKVLAENLRNSGDYFINVYPGKNTERYLFHKVSIMATVGAAFNSIIIGIPMLISLGWPSTSIWAQFVPTVILIMVLMQEIYKQFQQVYHRNDYKRFVHGEVLYK